MMKIGPKPDTTTSAGRLGKGKKDVDFMDPPSSPPKKSNKLAKMM
jgi:hypothetical protein